MPRLIFRPYRNTLTEIHLQKYILQCKITVLNSPLLPVYVPFFSSAAKVPVMPKIFCIVSLVISAILLLVFLLNTVAGIPFGKDGGMLVNIGMIIASLIIGVFSVFTFLEIK